MCPVLYGLNPEAVTYGNGELAWDPTYNNSTTEPTEVIDWFALPPAPTLLGSGLGSAILRDEIIVQSPRQPDRLGPTWKAPASSLLENASSGADSQALATASNTHLDMPCTSDDGTRQQNSTQSRYTTERKLAKNREAQRRFRQRHKARSHDVEAQLAATTAQLEELRSRQQQLEARNVLLEKISYLSRKTPPAGHAALDESHPNYGAYSAAQSSVQHLPSLTISLPGQQRTMSMQEASQLSLQQFSALYTDYNCEIGACLLQLTERQDNEVQARMQVLTLEAISLTSRTMLNPANHRAIINARLDDATPVSQKPGKAFYQGLLMALNLSQAQVQDLLFLRRLNLTRRCTLSTERKVLLHQMAASEAEALNHRSDNLQVVSLMAAQLQQITAEDRQVYYKLARALYRGVLSSRQLSEAMVHAYPHIAVVETLLETLADDKGAPSKDQIVAAAPMNPMTAEWEAFLQYVAKFDSGTWYEYVPVLHHQ
ncbi:TPA: hypothetical protein ACH3X2_007626 [Trebouxia sp. C0005]|nr:MAG: hypothetical protein FRX49_12866 [Trebouxia sp. A1-2]